MTLASRVTLNQATLQPMETLETTDKNETASVRLMLKNTDWPTGAEATVTLKAYDTNAGPVLRLHMPAGVEVDYRVG